MGESIKDNDFVVFFARKKNVDPFLDKVYILDIDFYKFSIKL